MKSSLIKTMGKIDLPKYEGDNIIYMQPIDFENPDMENDKWNGTVKDLVERTGIKKGIGYVTVDQKTIKGGDAQRRGGRHIDGNYGPTMGWNTWNTSTIKPMGWATPSRWGNPDTETPKPRWVKPTWNTNTLDNGGILLVSDVVGCRAWEGVLDGEYGEGGSCEHIDVSQMNTFKMKENVVYLGNHFIHESIPVEKTTNRTLVRLTLPNVA
jgi:hypothetical protein